MRTRSEAYAVVAVWLIIAVACSGGREEAEHAPAATEGRGPSVGVEGQLWAVAGPDGGNSRLYKVEWEGLRTRTIDDLLVTTVAGCKDLVVATAWDPEEGGFAVDHLMRAEPDGLNELPGLGRPLANTPALSEDCQLAYVETPSGPDKTFVVKTWRLDEEEASVLLRSREPPGRVRWREGSLLISVGEKERELLKVSDDGQTTPTGIRFSTGEGYWITDDGWIAFARPLDLRKGSRFERFEGERKEELRLPGWVPLAVGPSGTELLMRSEDELGVLELPDLDVRSLGEWRYDPIWDAAWVEAGSSG